jgi:hypothetical protein
LNVVFPLDRLRLTVQRPLYMQGAVCVNLSGFCRVPPVHCSPATLLRVSVVCVCMAQPAKEVWQKTLFVNVLVAVCPVAHLPSSHQHGAADGSDFARVHASRQHGEQCFSHKSDFHAFSELVLISIDRGKCCFSICTKCTLGDDSVYNSHESSSATIFRSGGPAPCVWFCASPSTIRQVHSCCDGLLASHAYVLEARAPHCRKLPQTRDPFASLSCVLAPLLTRLQHLNLA